MAVRVFEDDPEGAYLVAFRSCDVVILAVAPTDRDVARAVRRVVRVTSRESKTIALVSRRSDIAPALTAGACEALPREVEAPELGRRVIHWWSAVLADQRQRRALALFRKRYAETTARMRRLEEEVASLSAASCDDPVTGLPGADAFDAQLHLVVAICAAYSGCVSLLRIHLPDADPETLQGVADRLREACRISDVAARAGKEQLALLLPATDAAGAHRVAARLRAQLQGVEASFELTTLRAAGTDSVKMVDELLDPKNAGVPSASVPRSIAAAARAVGAPLRLSDDGAGDSP